MFSNVPEVPNLLPTTISHPTHTPHTTSNLPPPTHTPNLIHTLDLLHSHTNLPLLIHSPLLPSSQLQYPTWSCPLPLLPPHLRGSAGTSDPCLCQQHWYNPEPPGIHPGSMGGAPSSRSRQLRDRSLGHHYPFSTEQFQD